MFIYDLPCHPINGIKFLSVKHVNIRPVRVLWEKMFPDELRGGDSITVSQTAVALLALGTKRVRNKCFRGLASSRSEACCPEASFLQLLADPCS